MIKSLAWRLVSVLGTALLLMFFSEYFFLNEGPVRRILASLSGEFDPMDFLELAMYYCLFAYVFLIVMDRFSVSTIAALVLAGSIYGWAAEAMAVPIAYESPPISWFWTSVSWHALVDVIIGWYLIRLAMRHLSAPKLIGVFIVTGLGWAVWATWFWGDTEAGALAPLSPAQFWGYVAATGAIWIGGMVLADRGAMHSFQTSWLEIGLVGLISTGLLGITGLAFLPLSLGLLVLIGLAFAALTSARKASNGRSGFFDRLKQPPPRSSYLLAITMPLAAGLGYWGIIASGITFGIADIILVLLFAGVFIFIWAMWRCFTAKPTP